MKLTECINVEGGTTCGLYIRRRYKTQLNFCQADQAADRSKLADSKIREFASHLLPLIVETWVEASSSEQLNHSEGLIRLTST